MSIFSRKRAAARDVEAEEAEVGESATRATAVRTSTPRPNGPWDISERSQPSEGYLDLGALWLLPREGMELRLDLDEATGAVTTLTIQLAGSAVQLQAFAAPRTEGIWEEIRTEIATGITQQGGTVEEVIGVFGPELLARIPARTPDGRTGHQPARFCGVDGPRWFLRAVFHGEAVHDTEAAAELEDVVRDLVIVRGDEAMAPRDLLALQLPASLTEQAPHEAADEEYETDPDGAYEASEDNSRFRSDDLNPFERGPEITEVR